MEHVTGIALGAILALVGSVILQLLVVPAAEVRRRRQERWEQTLTTLGEKLIFEELTAADEMIESHNGVLKARESHRLTPADREAVENAIESGEDLDHPWFEEVSTAYDGVWGAHAEHEREMVRIGWLMAKLQADAPRGRDLTAVQAAFERFCTTAVDLLAATEVEGFNEYAPLGEAGFDDVALRMEPLSTPHAEARDAFLLEVKRLLAGKAQSRRGEFRDPYLAALESRYPNDVDEP